MKAWLLLELSERLARASVQYSMKAAFALSAAMLMMNTYHLNATLNALPPP